MSEEPVNPNGLVRSVRRWRDRRKRALAEGEPSVGRYLGQIGVLGWMIVAPTLMGIFLGRWIDRGLDMGIFWTAALMLLGLVAGCWSAWRWMHLP